MRLVKMSNFNWHVEDQGNVLLGGTLQSCIRYLMVNEGVDAEEIEFALKEIREKNLSRAIFGINRFFIYAS